MQLKPRFSVNGINMHQYSISRAVFKDRKTKKKENDRKKASVFAFFGGVDSQSSEP